MKHFTLLVVAIAAIVSLVAFSVPAPGHADAPPAPFVTEIPNGTVTGGGFPRPMKLATSIV